MLILRKIGFDLGRSAKFLSTCAQKSHKVAILGAHGGIGQPLALLMKQSLLVSDLALYDVSNVAGVAMDLSHIETASRVTAHTGPNELKAALTSSELVLIPAGVPRKPGMTRDDLFTVNASIVADLAGACGKYCPDAMICIITNPVNSTVPIAAEILKRMSAYNPKRLFGVTTLDITRANSFIAEAKVLDVSKVSCPVIGGHSGNTIIPLISHCNPPVNFSKDAYTNLVKRIQNAGTEVVEAKRGTGSATLSMAYAGSRFAISLLHAMNGAVNIVECTFVESHIMNAEFFASPVLLGPNGVEDITSIGTLKAHEAKMLEDALPELKSNIEKGQSFAKSYVLPKWLC